jgi:hypothetical protein
MDRFLKRLGFDYRTGQNDHGITFHFYEHKESGCKLLFGDYPADEPLPNHAAQPTYDFLRWYDLIDDMTYGQFLDLFAKAKAG